MKIVKHQPALGHRNLFASCLKERRPSDRRIVRTGGLETDATPWKYSSKGQPVE
jgi:hypothetical protein